MRTALLELSKDPLANRQVKRLAGTDALLRLQVGDLRCFPLSRMSASS